MRTYPKCMHSSWHTLISLDDLYSTVTQLPKQISPKEPASIFRAFSLPRDQVKIVIVGQDPYPDVTLAMGKAFAVPYSTTNNKIPPSLYTLFKAIGEVQGFYYGDLELVSWEEKGILLLNSALTCTPGKPGTHTHIWKPFMQKLFQEMCLSDNYIWYLMGKTAAEFAPLLKGQYVVIGNHPAVTAYKQEFENKFEMIYRRYKYIYGENLLL